MASLEPIVQCCNAKPGVNIAEEAGCTIVGVVMVVRCVQLVASFVV